MRLPILCALWVSFSVVGADLTVDDLDLFDVVEEVKQNFYEFLEVPANATTSDIRKAYRRLSLRYHPDRNSDPDAPERFRKIAAVMEVLRDEKKRAKYHEVLEYGIPDWARSMYYRYYRKARKMGTLEMSIMMSIIATVAHGLWMYASYWEKKFTINSNLEEALKRKKLRSTNAKKNKIAADELNGMRDELMSHIRAPVLTDIWFIRMPVGLFYAIIALPKLISELVQKNRERRAEQEESEEEEVEVRPKRTPRQRDNVKGAEVVNSTAPVVTTTTSATKNGGMQKVKTSPWTDGDVAMLIRLLKKFPSGTQDRWERIAESLERSVADVNKKVLTLRKDTTTNVIPAAMNSSKTLWVESEISTKDEEEQGGDGDSDASEEEEQDDDPANWTQSQQKQLETAMVAFPKFTDGRWDLIADRVSGKSKKHCIDRVKWLIESVKNKDQEA